MSHEERTRKKRNVPEHTRENIYVVMHDIRTKEVIDEIYDDVTTMIRRKRKM